MKKQQNVLCLKPTQFAIGMKEIEAKVREYQDLSKKDRRKLIRKTVIPVVVSPHKELFLVDHHHFLFMCWSLGVKKVRIKIIEDLSRRKLSFDMFWKWMHKHKYFYPYSQFGDGPHNPLYLPDDIRGLGDDPYRSLAWYARKNGACENSDETFAEFAWADFFRDHKLLDIHGKRGFEKAITQAIKLASGKEAKRLPGFIGERKTVKKPPSFEKELRPK